MPGRTLAHFHLGSAAGALHPAEKHLLDCAATGEICVIGQDPPEIAGACAAAMPSEYSGFQPLLDSADVIPPIINLRQEVDWAPRIVHADSSRWPPGELVRGWEWFQIVAGWMLSLLFVSAIGGAIGRE